MVQPNPGFHVQSPVQASADAGRVAAGFESLLFRMALEPLAKPLGFFGEAAASALAEALARGSRDGLRARLEALVDAAR